MNRIVSLMLIIAVSVLSVNTYAAFPAQNANPASQQQVAANRAELRKAIKMSPAPAPHNLSNTEVGLVIGILALVFGTISLVASPVAAMIFAAAAIVIGLMGME